MRYRKFDSRLSGDEVEMADILVHSVALLDHGAIMAIEQKDVGMLIKIYDRMIKANDRLAAMSLHFNEQEENNGELIKSGSGQFGFQLPETAPPSGIDCEEDGTER